MVDFDKIATLDQVAKKLKDEISEEVALMPEWHAYYSMITTYKKAPHAQGERFKKNIDSSLVIRNFSHMRYDYNPITIGEMVNIFLGIFRLVKSVKTISDAEIDIDRLNSFLEKFCYPPVRYEIKLSEKRKLPLVLTANNGTTVDYAEAGYKTDLLIFNPFEEEIKNYIIALKEMFFEIRDASAGGKALHYNLGYTHYFNEQAAGRNMTQNQNSAIIVANTINDLILYDASNSLTKFQFKLCPHCKKYFFKTNPNQKVCPYGCKPPSAMTKAELIKDSVKSNNLRSNNFDRKALLKKLSRKGLSDDEKNKELKKRGFELLKKTKVKE